MKQNSISFNAATKVNRELECVIMRIIIIGAGELGRLLALTLTDSGHDVVIVDNSHEELSSLTDRIDAMPVEGSCASVATLKKAGASEADALLAVSGDEAANILACQIGSKLGIKNTVCRLYSSDSFSDDDNISASDFGIWKAFSQPEETVRKIRDVLSNRILLERMKFSNPDAQMAVLEITRASFLAGIRIKDIPGSSDIIKTVRLAALVRETQFLVPHGDTILVPGDKIYVVGHRDNVQRFIDWITPENIENGRIVIFGTDYTGRALIREALAMGRDVRVIEKNLKQGEETLGDLPAGLVMIHGDPTDEEILEEAGVPQADVFVSTSPVDEDNILSCIMAKRLGVKKCVSLSHKPEYISIVPTMNAIDCGFSATLIAANTVLRLLESGMMRLDAMLRKFNANLTEFKVTSSSPLTGKPLSACKLPVSAVLALVFRNGEVITPSGSTVLQAGDTAVAILTNEALKELIPLFPKK